MSSVAKVLFICVAIELSAALWKATSQGTLSKSSTNEPVNPRAVVAAASANSGPKHVQSESNASKLAEKNEQHVAGIDAEIQELVRSMERVQDEKEAAPLWSLFGSEEFDEFGEEYGGGEYGGGIARVHSSKLTIFQSCVESKLKRCAQPRIAVAHVPADELGNVIPQRKLNHQPYGKSFARRAAKRYSKSIHVLCCDIRPNISSQFWIFSQPDYKPDYKSDYKPDYKPDRTSNRSALIHSVDVDS